MTNHDAHTNHSQHERHAGGEHPDHGGDASGGADHEGHDKHAGHSWVPYMRTASLERLDGGVAVCEGLTNLPWPLKDRTWTVRMRTEVEDGGERYVASWEYVPESGNLEDTHGAWSLEVLEDGRTRVRLHAVADLGGSVPGPMLRWAEKKALPEMLEALIRESGVSE